MRMIVLEGQIEIYIDDILVLQNAFETKDMKFGLAVGSGRCLYKDFKIYTLENETGCTS